MKPGTREYQNLHKQLTKLWGQPSYCEFCFINKTDSKYHWAHKHETSYTIDRLNWFRLCVPCHSQYDISPQVRQEIGRLGGLACSIRGERSETTRAKISETLKLKGIVPPNQKGRTWKMSEESKKRVSEAAKLREAKKRNETN